MAFNFFQRKKKTKWNWKGYDYALPRSIVSHATGIVHIRRRWFWVVNGHGRRCGIHADFFARDGHMLTIKRNVTKRIGSDESATYFRRSA